ncbi:MAG: Rieske 2Fe-2S domain-containing protein [Deltaproteobacteria bacterium]|nr:Rieske 2Fe-2S domain-containing protein [Deltaproteobacteria bacterium]
MSSSNFYPKPIPLDGLSPTALNVRAIGDSENPVDVVVVVDGGEYRIVRDLCPHMGAPLSQGKLCTEERKLSCPWHGYEFNLASGELMHNPNDEIYGCMKTLYKSFNPAKTPKYRLRVLPYEVRGGEIHVRRGVSS